MQEDDKYTVTERTALVVVRRKQEDDKYTVTERTALVLARLTKGERLRTVDVAEALGMTWSGAWRLMVRISRVAPLTQDDTGAWYILRDCVD